MPFPSQFKSTCKDCGMDYDIGDYIDANGEESPNKKGEIKAHWCRYGKECQGTTTKGIDFSKMQRPVQGTAHPLNPQSPTDIETSPEELLALGKKLLGQILLDAEVDDFIQRHYKRATKVAATILIEKAAIDTVMNDAGIKHPGRVAFTAEVMQDLRE